MSLHRCKSLISRGWWRKLAQACIPEVLISPGDHHEFPQSFLAHSGVGHMTASSHVLFSPLFSIIQ
jgi:hypothetical protein